MSEPAVVAIALTLFGLLLMLTIAWLLQPNTRKRAAAQRPSARRAEGHRKLKLGTQMEVDKWDSLDQSRLIRDMEEAKVPNGAGLDEMIDTMERAYEDHPNSWEIAYKLGDLYQWAGRYADSIAVCFDCIRLRPNDPRSRYALATAYRMPDLTTEQIIEQCMKVPEPGLSLLISRHEARYWFREAFEITGPRSRKRIEIHIQALIVQYNNLFRRAMDADFERYLAVRELSISLDAMEQYLTECWEGHVKR